MNTTKKAMRYLLLSILAVFALSACKNTKVESRNNKTSDSAMIINGHRFVDLQLPSGVLWAETNVGAETPVGYGALFAWGEVRPKSDCSQETYRYGSDFDRMTKYNASDRKTTLVATDDAATANWGDGCRMPTQKEFEELCDTANCTWVWTKLPVAGNDSISGYEVKSVRNSNAIFLPAAGARNGKETVMRGDNAVYWTSTRDVNQAGNATCVSFYFANYRCYENARYIGSSIRPVAERPQKKTNN